MFPEPEIGDVVTIEQSVGSSWLKLLKLGEMPIFGIMTLYHLM